MSQKSSPFHVATIGVDKQTIKILELVFQGPAKGAYDLVATPQQANAVIFDFDCLSAETLWQSYRDKHPHLPTMIFSLQIREMANIVFVQKPLQIERVLKGLATLQTLPNVPVITAPPPKVAETSHSTHDIKLAQELAIEAKEQAIHEYCGYLEDIDPNAPDQIEKIYYDPSKYLQGFLEKAYQMSQEQPHAGIWVDGLADPMILQGSDNLLKCATGWDEQKLRTMTLIPLTKRLQFRPIDAKEIQQLETKYHFAKQPLDNALWKVALWTARGHLPRGINLHHRVILNEWPNFTRLIVTPHALQITALWATRPSSLIETAHHLNIKQRYVFSLFSAAAALKLVATDRHNQDAIATFSKHAKRSILQRILARLQ
jgi:hypothetical protein